jgi:hypothetical protein
MPPPLFELKNDLPLELPLLDLLEDPFFFLTPPEFDLSFHFVAPFEPPRRPPRPLRKLVEPLLWPRAVEFCDPGRFFAAAGIV